MKHPIVGALLLVAFGATAQPSFKYNAQKIPNTCERGFDSMVRNNISMPYDDIGVTKEYNGYDAQNRVVSFSRYIQGGFDMGYTIHRRQVGNGFRDSTFMVTGSNPKSASVAIYGSDSLCIKTITYGRILGIEQIIPVRETTYDYEVHGDMEVRNGRFWNISESGQRDSGLTYSQLKYRGGKLFSDSSWGKYKLNTYHVDYNRYQGDTIVNYSWDSSMSTYYVVNENSLVTIYSRVGDKQIVHRTSFNSMKSEPGTEGEFYNEYRSVDTIGANNNGTSWNYDEATGKYVPYRKWTRVEEGNIVSSIGYRWNGSQWQNDSKGELWYMDESRKCRGQQFTYVWKNGRWELGLHTVYYYNGVTAQKEETTTVCKLPNPFSPSLPFSCELLLPEQQYTLEVFDLSGKKIIEKQFYVDQSIGELVMLNSGNLYYFVITGSNKEVISTQKIVMGN